MVLAASHVIAALGLSFLVSKYSKVTKLGYALAAFGALVPDFDFLPALIFSDMGWHRAYLNFIWIPFVIFGVLYLLFPKRKMESMMFCLGYLSHVILDLINAELLMLAILDGIVLTIVVTGIIIYYLVKREK